MKTVSFVLTCLIAVPAGSAPSEASSETVSKAAFDSKAASEVSPTSATSHAPMRREYPVHWWKRHPESGKPAWEILPHEAKPGEVILSKRNELGLLSNFAATPFEFRGKRYASLEGFWQMMLYPEGSDDPRAKFPGLEWKHTREQVAQMTAFEAKHAGELAKANMKKMGIDWVTFEGRRMPYRSAQPGEHYELIVGAMRAKLSQNANVRDVLLKTGDLILKPDHHDESTPPPEWKYYEIWMKLRSELQAEGVWGGVIKNRKESVKGPKNGS